MFGVNYKCFIFILQIYKLTPNNLVNFKRKLAIRLLLIIFFIKSKEQMASPLSNCQVQIAFHTLLLITLKPYFTQLAFMALIMAEVKPSCSSSLMPLIVIPPGVHTLSISILG